MFAPGWRSALAATVLSLAAGTPAPAETPAHAKAPVKTVSTERSAYRLVQGGNEIGGETVQRTVYDNNTIAFHCEGTLAPAPGVSMAQKIDLSVEEESFFPRSFHSVKTISQGGDQFDHELSVEMFANVAVISSAIRGVHEERRVVVPVGVAIQETGVLFYWYQTLFWYDPKSGGRQRFQWLDPNSGAIDSGEIYATGDETLQVMGKKRAVTVFKADRPKIGSATLYVDGGGRIVKCEQNLTEYELVEQSGK